MHLASTVAVLLLPLSCGGILPVEQALRGERAAKAERCDDSLRQPALLEVVAAVVLRGKEQSEDSAHGARVGPGGQVALEELLELVDQLESKMKEAAKKLDFEDAANLRDRIKQLRQKMAG